MSRFLSKKKLMPLLAVAILISVIMVWCAVSAFATTASTEETASASVTLAGITMSENSSFSSDEYFGVIHLIVGDTSVVTASVDSENHVVITAVGSGSTTVKYWYKASSSDGWTSAAMNVKVQSLTGTSPNADTSPVNTGICFPQSRYSLAQSETSLITGIIENGQPVSADKLLWVSSSNSVVTVESTTGKITAAGNGTATLYALDPVTKICNGVAVQVN